MLNDYDFCHFTSCNYSILGNMENTTVYNFEELLHETLPESLRAHLTNKIDDICYIRRGFDNVVFSPDLHLNLIDLQKGGV